MLLWEKTLKLSLGNLIPNAAPNKSVDLHFKSNHSLDGSIFSLGEPSAGECWTAILVCNSALPAEC